MTKGADRRQQILRSARLVGHVEVSDTAEQMDVAAETVRRDLRVLEEHGLLRRTHGGAYPVESVGYESTPEHRSENWVAEKRRIAIAAVDHLDAAETVFLDEGYTPQLIAQELVTLGRSLTVVTSSLAAAMVMANAPTLTVIMLGGRVRGATLGTVEHWATGMLQSLSIDVAIVGANGVSREHGLTTPDPTVAAVKQNALAASRRHIYVGIHTKFGVSTFCRFAEVRDFELLITDRLVSASEANKYSALGPAVVRA